MDKYEFNVKIEQLKKRVKEGDFATAMSICDTIDWRRVSSVSLLSMVSEVYEKNHDYKEAREVLMLAYEKAPIGKRLLFKLCLLSIKEGNVNDAETYYREFYDLAPEDNRQHVLRYLILKAKGAPVEQLINSLETYVRTELDEQYMYELAELYHQAGKSEECVAMCDKILLMFGIGNYVDKAIELKTSGEGHPLTEYQQGLVDNREEYEERLNQVSRKYMTDEADDNVIDAEGIINAVDSFEVEEQGPVIDVEPEETKVIPVEEIKSAIVKSPIADFMANPEPKVEEDKPVQKFSTNYIVERKTPEAGFEAARTILRLLHDNTGSTNGVIKIKASKLNARGVMASAERLAGKDLIIEEAGDLAFDTVEQIVELIRREPAARIIIFVDNPMQLNKVLNAHPNLTDFFRVDRDDSDPARPAKSAQTPAGTPQANPVPVREVPVRPAVPTSEQVVRVAETMKAEAAGATDDAENNSPLEPQLDIEAFAQECVEYAEEIDCSISGKSMLALYERIEIMEEDGIPLTRANAIDLIEDAADRAEKKGIGALFVKKYDKDDKLILREEHFLP